jgi:2-polyprenyl-6-methoxyphenol hydroxylase-like FAD-dependent oxidoreductase
MRGRAGMTYSRYLRLNELLSLQQPLTPACGPEVRDSERLFIAVHQASETLLSQALTDLRYVIENPCDDETFDRRLDRTIRVVGTLEGHLRLLWETLPRQDFLDFRDRLGTASGNQSRQFHELFALTAKLAADAGAGTGTARAVHRLRDAVVRWRRTHLEMVEHMIGEAPGTATNSGIGYLASELEQFEHDTAGGCPLGHGGEESASETAGSEREPGPASAAGGARLGRVVVLGGSVAGLLAAHVLAAHADRVMVLERDHPADENEPRPGVPQGKHTHVFLAGGINALERLLPGLPQELTAEGAPCLSIPEEVGVWQAGQWVSRRNPSAPVLTPSRPFVEQRIRCRVLSHPRIELVTSIEATGLLGTPDRITGVRTRTRGAKRETGEYSADLVVDATGRGSQTDRWLTDLGAPAPEEEAVETGRAYATCAFHADDEILGNDLRGFYIVPDVHQPLGAIILPAENNRWLVTLSGPRGQEPPTDLEGFVEFARGLPHHSPYTWLTTATAAGRPLGYRRTGNRRRRYDLTARRREGLLVVGDALCALNPVYGQGMSVAALNAVALDRALARSGTRFSAYEPQRAVLRSGDAAWQVATGADSPMPGVTGNAVRSGPVPRLLDWYLERVRVHVPGDPVVCKAFRDVLFLLAPPSSLLTSARVVGRSLLRPPTPTPPGLPTR